MQPVFIDTLCHIISLFRQSQKVWLTYLFVLLGYQRLLLFYNYVDIWQKYETSAICRSLDASFEVTAYDASMRQMD